MFSTPQISLPHQLPQSMMEEMANFYETYANFSRSIVVYQEILQLLQKKTGNSSYKLAAQISVILLQKWLGITQRFWANPANIKLYSEIFERKMREKGDTLLQAWSNFTDLGKAFGGNDKFLANNFFPYLPKTDFNALLSFNDSNMLAWQQWINQLYASFTGGHKDINNNNNGNNNGVLQDKHKHYLEFLQNFYDLHSQTLFELIETNIKTNKNQQASGGAEKNTELVLLDFLYRHLADMGNPKNNFYLNGQAMQKFLESKGGSLLNGLQNMKEDIVNGRDQGLISIKTVDGKNFVLGENLASTQGKVVFENRIMQVIQYNPTTEQVNEVPILLMMAWINKYYILDLNEKKSLVKWLVDQGNTVFIISWINPDETMRETSFADYLNLGILEALRVAREFSGSAQVNCFGYCLGGTLLSIAAAYLQKIGDKSIKSITLIASLVDFSDAGVLGLFIDDQILQAIEGHMEEVGYLDGSLFFATFSALKSNDMVWRYFVRNYLLGEDPEAFDILYWNSDSTRLTNKMHAFYLRKFYQENLLVQGQLIINDHKIQLSDIKVPIYTLGTELDHISPWTSVFKGAAKSYKNARTVRFVLGGSGHTAGVINHPKQQKYSYYTNEKQKDLKIIEDNLELWRSGAQKHEGSWWLDWQEWLNKEHLTGAKIAAEKRNIPAERAIESAPGSYVRKRY